jgi:hypothetical protein
MTSPLTSQSGRDPPRSGSSATVHPQAGCHAEDAIIRIILQQGNGMKILTQINFSSLASGVFHNVVPAS